MMKGVRKIKEKIGRVSGDQEIRISGGRFN